MDEFVLFDYTPSISTTKSITFPPPMAVAKAQKVVLRARRMELIGVGALMDRAAADEVVAFLAQFAEHAVALEHLSHL